MKGVGGLVSKQYYVYIMTIKHNTVLYTGVTNDLRRRAHEHRTGQGGGFTSRYNVTKLVYYEVSKDARAANEREKQIKGGSRQKKLDLIEGMNLEWRDLSGAL
ncbi:GIY-YIG nuclease family protein [Chloroflexota bacterium]